MAIIVGSGGVVSSPVKLAAPKTTAEPAKEPAATPQSRSAILANTAPSFMDKYLVTAPPTEQWWVDDESYSGTSAKSGLTIPELAEQPYGSTALTSPSLSAVPGSPYNNLTVSEQQEQPYWGTSPKTEPVVEYETRAKAVGAWLKNQFDIGEAWSDVVKNVTSPEQSPITNTTNALKTIFGNPFSESDGLLWKNALGWLNGAAVLAKRLIATQDALELAPEEYFSPDAYSYGAGIQANRVYLPEGYDTKKQTVEAPKKLNFFGGTPTNINPLGFSDDIVQAWNDSKYTNYTHLMVPGAMEEYEKLVDSGVSKEDASLATRDEVVESTYEILIDPFWVIPGDTLIVNALWTTVKAPFKGAGAILSKLPLTKRAYSWLAQETITTVANKVGRNSDDILRQVKAFADDTGQLLNGDLVARTLKEAPEEFSGGLYNYYKRALLGAKPYADEIAKAIDDGLKEANLKVIQEEAARRIGVGATKEAIDKVAQDIVWDNVIAKANLKARSAAATAYIQAHPKVAAAAKASIFKIGDTITSTVKGVYMDVWLGSRPSWLIYNYVDNLQKLVLYGANPFASIPAYMRRYAPYAADPDAVLRAADEFEAVKGFGTSATLLRQELLKSVGLGQMFGTFSQGVVQRTVEGTVKGTEGTASLLRKVPGFKQLIEWTTATSGGIELSMRSRLYFKHFFDVVDKGWDMILKQDIVGTAGKLPDDLAAVVKTRLGGLKYPTPARVQETIAKMIAPDKVRIIAPRLGQDLAQQFTKIPVPIKGDVVSDLILAADEAALSDGTLSLARLRRTFDEAAKNIAKSYDFYMEQGLKGFESLPTLPENPFRILDVVLPKGQASTLEDVFQAMDDMPAFTKRAMRDSLEMSTEFRVKIGQLRAANAPHSEIAKAFEQFMEHDRPAFWDKFLANQEEAWQLLADKADELLLAAKGTKTVPVNAAVAAARAAPAQTVSVTREQLIAKLDTDDLFKNWSNMPTAPGQRDSYRQVLGDTWDMFMSAPKAKDATLDDIKDFLSRNKAFANKNTKEYASKAMYDFLHPSAAQAAATAVVQTTTQVPVAKFPRELIAQYSDSVKALNQWEKKKWSKWRNLWDRVYSGTMAYDVKEMEIASTTKKFDKEFTKLKLQTKDAVHQSMTRIRQFFVEQGLEVQQSPSLVELSKNAGWWRVDEQLDNIPVAAQRIVGEQLEELRYWWKVVSEQRVSPFTEYVLDDITRTSIREWGTSVADQLQELVSHGIDSGIKDVNDNLFDYETTNNLMALVGQVVPFVRFPAKNIPYWMEKFANVPHLVGTVAKIRMAHASINKDLPSRMRYTVAIPTELTDWLMEPLGFHNSQLRINPYSFFSVFQAMPGATEFSRRRLEELSQDAGDEQNKQNFRLLTTIADDLGFGMWPYLEWFAGMYGLLGNDWYPRDAFGTWSPLFDWTAHNVFGAEKGFDADRAIRTAAPQVWNAVMTTVFGDNTKMTWEQLTPDLMLRWMQGREERNIIMNTPDEVVMQAFAMTPVEARAIVRGLDDATKKQLAEPLKEFFSRPAEEQLAMIKGMSQEEKALLVDEIEREALRTTMAKRMLTTVMGNMTGAYFDITGLGEIEARQLNLDRNALKQSLEPGQQARDSMKQWYVDNPKWGVMSEYTYSQFPWSPTASGREGEIWDGITSQYKSQVLDYKNVWNEKRAKAIAETYSQYPGDITRLRQVYTDFQKQYDEYVAAKNTELRAELTRRMEAYKKQYPNDPKGIELLENGWETDVYVGTTLNEAERERLRVYQKANPDDAEGYREIFTEIWDEAVRNRPPTQKKMVPGLKDGISIDLRWSPVGNPLYTEDEIQDYMIGNVLYQLRNNAPSQDDYEDGKKWWEDYQEYQNNLTGEALKLPEVQDQIAALMKAQGLTRAQATAEVSEWYDQETMQESYKKNDTPWEALEWVYSNRVYAEARDEWYDELEPLRKKAVASGLDTDWDNYNLRKAQFDLDYAAAPASDLAHYILEEYPDKWTVAELDKLFGDMVMPSYDDRNRLKSTGTKRIDNEIWYYYNKLDADGKRKVRTEFGPLFSDSFITGEAETISVTMKGEWVEQLSALFGAPIDYRKLPGVDDEYVAKLLKQNIDVGLPNVKPADEAEYAIAAKRNKEYWELMLAGKKEQAAIVENDPLRLKWFGLGTAKSYFWYAYYNLIPPGTAARDLKAETLVKLILDKDARNEAATNSDYDRATAKLEEWLSEYDDDILRAGLDPKEYAEVSALFKQYNVLRYENNDKRAASAFIKANPIMKKYFNAYDVITGKKSYSSSSGGGGGGYSRRSYSSGGSSYSSAAASTEWDTLKTRVGQSFSSVIRMLEHYWDTGEMNETVRAYLEKVYNEIGGEVGFDTWVELLHNSYTRAGSSSSYQKYSSVNVPSVRSAPTPDYPTGTRGVRR